MNKVEFIPFHSCWEWNASKHRFGYDWFNDGHKIEVAHRISYRLFKGEIPQGKLIMHTCDNPGCVNPAHLILGTNTSNAQDKVKKDRQSKGSKNGTPKLTEENAVLIRDMYATSEYTMQQLANQFNVSLTLIFLVIRRRNWKHV